VPHMFIVTFVIMLPITLATKDPINGWEAGLVWVFFQSFILMIGGFIAPIVRKITLDKLCRTLASNHSYQISVHQTLKNRILLENYYLPGDLEAKIGDFVAHYNHLRYHESIANLTPADVYFGRGQTILLERERIKRQTLQNRRLHHRGQAALHHSTDAPDPPFDLAGNRPKCFVDGHLTP
jgi:hypothetical protein